ncbi:Nramp family divalent metal transporter [uncultured Acidaminococcus sp.]|jgi:manganese transport protein|uniref:Nramp family divalent metal transporter n=1 Tax=uncultured Acidaminococcus sp. TaxID=352152 RepID=UPI0026DD47D1|nr:Nramp family divalent metal transporter [uncultured Acidaminococcus sp.]
MYIEHLGFDPETVPKLTFLQMLKRIGPGIVLTGVVIGPGAITTASMLGANYGYDMLWLFIPIFIMGITFMLTCYRITMLTGLPIIHAIRHFYGKAAAAFVGCCLFLACLFFTFGNISGSGAGMNLLFGINWKIGSLIMIAILLAMYFAKNTYSKVEKGILLCILAMIAAFYATLYVAGGPEWGGFFRGVTHWGFPNGSIRHSLAFISTHAAITAGVYGTYLGAEKKWNKKDMFNGTMLADAIAHVVTVILISGAVVLVGAIVLHPQGLRIKSPVQLADMLRPFLGSYANLVMGLALLGAAFSSLLGNTQRGVVLLNAGLDKDVSLESRLVRWSCTACIVFGCVICFLYNGSPTQLIFIANLATAIGTPTAGFFVTRMIWRKDVNEGLKPPRLLQISMTICYLFALGMTIYALVAKL